MSRHELIEQVEQVEQVEQIEFWPEIRPTLDVYIKQYIYAKYFHIVKLLLKAGASPNPKEHLDCYFHHFFHEYKVAKTISGELVLALLEELLKSGTNPNRVWCNNYRAYDYAVCEKIEPIVELLEKLGIDTTLRECI